MRRIFLRSGYSTFRRLSVEKLEHRLAFAGELNALDIGTAPTNSLAYASASGEASNPTATNRSITSSAGVQQMPSVAVDPHDSEHLVIAYMDYTLLETGYAGIGVAVSHDGGDTMAETSVPLPEFVNQGAANPTIQFDDSGHVYITFMAASFYGEQPPITNPDSGTLRALGFKSSNGIFVSRSDDGGETWMPARAVESHTFDGTNEVPFDLIPDISIDRFRTLPDGMPNPYYGTIYVTYSRYYPAGQFPGEPDSIGGSDLILATSSDLGEAWHIRQKTEESGNLTTVLQDPFNNGIDPPAGFGYNNYLHPAVGPEGDVYTAEYSGGWLPVNHSADGGSSFFIPTQEDEFGLPFGLGPVGLDFGLSSNTFRTLPVRAIVADPARPGNVYVAEPQSVVDKSGQLLDDSDIIFSRSTDYGQTWERNIQVGSLSTQNLNDDNQGLSASGAAGEVKSSQVMVKLATNSVGMLVAVWYDSRRDPANHRLDVFASVSSDGGKTFSSNFRISTFSFDPDLGAFRDGNDERNTYIGDALGLALTDTSMFVTWTDTRAGNQDIYFSKLDFDSLPAPGNDRFEPNETPNTATDLGVIVERQLSQLSIDASDNDWFKFQSVASGQLSITASGLSSALNAGTNSGISEIDKLHFDLQSADNTPIPFEQSLVRDQQGHVLEVRITATAKAGESYSLSVISVQGKINYRLEVKAFTADLGVLVHRVVDGTLQIDDEIYYVVESAADGSLNAQLVNAGAANNVRVEIIDPQNLSVLADNQSRQVVSTSTRKGQKLLIHLRGDQSSLGPYRLELSNEDQFNSGASTTFHFQAGVSPSQSVIDDFNGDELDDVAVSNAGSNTVSVLLSNGDGTFNAPRQFSVGAFRLPNPVADDFGLTTYRRDIASADFNGDGKPDIAVTNFDSSDISVLLGRGDGTFQPQRRFDATASPFGLTIGDVNNDGHLDILAVEGAARNTARHLAVLLGRGDGTFVPQKLILLDGILALPTISLRDLDDDGTVDLIVGGGLNDGIDIYRGQGTGTFAHAGHFHGSRQSGDIVINDVTGDGKLDIVLPSLTVPGSIALFVGHGDCTFDDAQTFFSGEGPLAIALVDWGSEIETADGIKLLGSPDGHLDAVVANSGASISVARPGPPEIVVLPQLVDADGNFLGFGAPQRISDASQPLDIEVTDFDRDGELDLGVVDREQFLAIFATPPVISSSQTLATAQDLGQVVHLVQPTLTITPTNLQKYYRLTVPVEGSSNSHDEVLDISSGIQFENGAGIRMEILDEAGRVLATGDRVRIRAAQGQTLYVHIDSVTDATGISGTGAYTLIINTLPQVVAVDAESLLPGVAGKPGGSTSTIVITFQGDRLDRSAAQELNNYRVIYWGTDGVPGTADDGAISIGGENVYHPVIYDESANVDITTGLTYPTAIKQTVTLVFAKPLTAGSYTIELSDRIRSASFNAEEHSLLSRFEQFGDHVLVNLDSTISPGALIPAIDLVQGASSVGNLSVFSTGTAFLTQLQNDLQALLDAFLSKLGDDPSITEALLQHIQARIQPGLGPESSRATSLLVLFFDPFPFAIANRETGAKLDYDRQANTLDRGLSDAYVQVGRNLDFVVIPQALGTYSLDVANVPQLPRMGAIVLSPTQTEIYNLTAQIRSGKTSFRFDIDSTTTNFSTPFLGTTSAAASRFVGESQPALQTDLFTRPNAISSRWERLYASTSRPTESFMSLERTRERNSASDSSAADDGVASKLGNDGPKRSKPPTDNSNKALDKRKSRSDPAPVRPKANNDFRAKEPTSPLDAEESNPTETAPTERSPQAGSKAHAQQLRSPTTERPLPATAPIVAPFSSLRNWIVALRSKFQ